MDARDQEISYLVFLSEERPRTKSETRRLMELVDSIVAEGESKPYCPADWPDEPVTTEDKIELLVESGWTREAAELKVLAEETSISD